MANSIWNSLRCWPCLRGGCGQAGGKLWGTGFCVVVATLPSWPGESVLGWTAQIGHLGKRLRQGIKFCEIFWLVLLCPPYFHSYCERRVGHNKVLNSVVPCGTWGYSTPDWACPTSLHTGSARGLSDSPVLAVPVPIAMPGYLGLCLTLGLAPGRCLTQTGGRGGTGIGCQALPPWGAAGALSHEPCCVLA